MVEASETPTGASIDRSERPGRVGLLLLLAALLVGAALSLSFVAPERAQPLILLLLALLAMAGVFFLFAMAIGVIQFSGQGARNDLTKVMADTAAEGSSWSRTTAASSTPTRATSTLPAATAARI